MTHSDIPSPPSRDGVADAGTTQPPEPVPAPAVPDGSAATGSLIDLNARCNDRQSPGFAQAALQVNSVHCVTPESILPATSYVNLAPTPQGFTPPQHASAAASLLECFDPLESRDRPPSRTGSDNSNPMGRSSVMSSLASSQSANKSFSFVNFWRHYPELWLETIEQKFAACGIFLDNDRYMHTLAALGTDVIAELGDSMRGLPMSNKYVALKALLQRKYVEHEKTKFLRFRDGLASACNRLPSDYLDYLVGSGDTMFNRDSILRWWSLTLPPHIAVHLDAEVTVANELDNVRRADEIYYRLQGANKAFPSVHKIDAPPAKVEHPVQEKVLAGLRNSIDILTQVLLNDSASRSSPNIAGQSGGTHGRNDSAKNNNYRNFNNYQNQPLNFSNQNLNNNNRKFKNNLNNQGNFPNQFNPQSFSNNSNNQDNNFPNQFVPQTFSNNQNSYTNQNSANSQPGFNNPNFPVNNSDPNVINNFHSDSSSVFVHDGAVAVGGRGAPAPSVPAPAAPSPDAPTSGGLLCVYHAKYNIHARKCNPPCPLEHLVYPKN
uniref:DUF7041 domain-containing protein n=1 Tax=Trichogramma kaykai TaxID=54128 RepID=A0ABD2XC19_9HYME